MKMQEPDLYAILEKEFSQLYQRTDYTRSSENVAWDKQQQHQQHLEPC